MRRLDMTYHFSLQPILAVVTGILISVKPSLLNHVVAILL
jgi:hypothetical protein